MSLKYYLCLFLLSLFGNQSVSAIEEVPPSSPFSQLHIKTSSPQENNTNTTDVRLVKLPNPNKRLSFPTRTGFVLLRKEEITFIEVDKLRGGILVHFQKQGKARLEKSNLRLSDIANQFSAFPFLKVSRSVIINLNEIEEYHGTRRDAQLLMSNGEKVKVSRRMATVLHDWIQEMGV